MPSDNALKGLFTLAKDYTCQLSTTVDMEQKCQLVHAATQCLLAIIHQGNASSMDLILRARCFLIQLLLDHTQRSKERSEEVLEMNESQSLDAFLLEFINQSIVLADQSPAWTSFKYQLMAFQCRFYLERRHSQQNQVVQIAKRALLESDTSVDLLNSFPSIINISNPACFLYSLQFLYYMLCASHTQALLQAHTKLLHYAEQLGLVDLQVFFMLSQLQAAQLQGEYGLCSKVLDRVHERLDAVSAPNRPMISLFYSILMILYHMHLGNTTLAGEHVTLCHALLETELNPGSEESESFAGMYRLPLSQNGFSSGYLNVQWLSKQDLTAVVYLLSGWVMASEPSLKASKRFLLEGIKFVEVSGANSFINQLKLLLYRQLGWTLLMNGDVEAAQPIVDCYMTMVYEDPSLIARSRHKTFTFLQKASLLQAEGNLEESIKWYESIVSRISDDEELRVAIRLQLGFLYAACGRTEHLIKLVAELHTVGVSHPLISVRATFFLLQGLECLHAKQYHRTKVHILDALKLCSSASSNVHSSPEKIQEQPSRFVCSQLKLLALTFIGEVYDATENEHCERMVNAAYAMALKMKCETLAALLGRLLCNWILLKEDQGLESEMILELNEKINAHQQRSQLIQYN